MRRALENIWLKVAALTLLVALLGLGPRPHRVMQDLELARQAQASGDAAGAARRLAAAAEKMPGRADLWAQAGHLALQAGDPQAAIGYLERIRDDLDAAGWADLGQAYRQAGDLPAAVRAWQQTVAATAHGEPPEVLLADLAAVQEELGDYPAASETLQALAARRPEDAALHYRLGLLQLFQQPERAQATLQQAARLDANLAPAIQGLRGALLAARNVDDPVYRLMSLGRALAGLGEWRLAEEAFYQASLARPDYAEAWAYLGEARQHTAENDGPEAEPGEAGLAELRKAVELDPRSLASHTFLALHWERRGEYDQALKAIEAALEIDPSNPALLAGRGNLQALLGDLQAAHATYLAAVAAAPRNPAYLRLLAGFAMKYDYQLAEVGLPAARQALMLKGDDPANLDLMAQVLIRLNDLVSAERFLHQALEKDEGYTPAHLHLGLVYLLQGDTNRARQALGRVKALAPGSPAAEQAEHWLQSTQRLQSTQQMQDPQQIGSP